MSSAWPNQNCPQDHTNNRWTCDDIQTHSPYWSRVRETDARASSILVCSSQTGAPCASAPDWANHPCLRTVPLERRREHRETKLTEWLEGHVARIPRETFPCYLVRCIAAAEQVLKVQKKLHVGDNYLHHVDKLAFKLFYGSRVAQQRHGVQWGVGVEELLLQLLREECVFLLSQGLLNLDPRKFNSAAVAPWPPREDIALHSAQHIPAGVVAFADMDSR